MFFLFKQKTAYEMRISDWSSDVCSSDLRQRRLAMPERDALKAWFLREILPLEPALMRFIRRNWRTEADVVDLRQEIYVRIYESACQRLPLNPKPFLFATARNHLIDRA